MLKICLAVGALVVGAACGAAPAVANPGPDCGGTLMFICNMLPVAPDLEGDIDLTVDQPPVPALPDVPPADPCAAGCY